MGVLPARGALSPKSKRRLPMEMEGEAALLVGDLLRATHQTLGWVFAFPHAGSPSKLPGAGGATLPHRVLCCWVRRARLCRSLSSIVERWEA